MEQNPRAEAERLLGVAEKLLNSGDFTGSREFAILAQETEPLLEGSDQILAVADVLLAADKRINNHHDWYAILQVDRRSDDEDLIKRQYRRLALLLHPDKNKYPFADRAFTLVADAWAVLSDTRKKAPYDHELNLFTRIDLTNSDNMQHGKLPVRRGQRSANTRKSNNNTRNDDEPPRSRLSTFWTMCPYCYILYEYPKVYEDCCIRCQNCQRAFHAAVVPNLPPLVPGKEAYYCCWGFFPLGFVAGNSEGVAAQPSSAFPNWMPPLFVAGNREGVAAQPSSAFPNWMPPLFTGGGDVAPVGPKVVSSDGAAEVQRGNVARGSKKRGRPRKNPIQL